MAVLLPVPQQEGLIFWGLHSLGSLSSIVLPSEASPYCGSMGRVSFPSLQDAEKMLSIMWKALLTSAHR